MNGGMTDIHQHLLWGIDDGPEHAQGMYDLLHSAHDQQITRIAATPHVYPGVQPFDMALYRKRLEEAQQYCDAQALGITLLPGAEIAWTYQTVEALRTGRAPTLNDSEYALVELWRDITWSEVRNAAQQLLRAGFTPVFAHVERYRCFMWQPGKAIRFKHDLPVCYQVNAPTLLASGGAVFTHFMKTMLDARAFDAIASDAHDCEFRPQQLKAAYDAVQKKCGGKYANRLVNFDGVCYDEAGV